jgi:hypothetical protein
MEPQAHPFEIEAALAQRAKPPHKVTAFILVISSWRLKDRIVSLKQTRRTPSVGRAC